MKHCSFFCLPVVTLAKSLVSSLIYRCPFGDMVSLCLCSYKVARKKVEIQPGLIEPKFSQVPIRYSVTEALKLAITLFLRFLISLQWSCDCTLLAGSLDDNAATPNVIVGECSIGLFLDAFIYQSDALTTSWSR